MCWNGASMKLFPEADPDGSAWGYSWAATSLQEIIDPDGLLASSGRVDLSELLNRENFQIDDAEPGIFGLRRLADDIGRGVRLPEENPNSGRRCRPIIS
jgi:hypothetical protein